MADMAFWEPRVMRHALPGGGEEFAIHEVHFAKDGVVVTYTLDSLSPRTSSVQELEAWIQSTLSEAEVGVVCGGQGYTYFSEDLSLWLDHVRETPIDFEPD